MPIAVVCAKCSAKLNAPDSAAGKRVKCPKCQNAIVVPQALPAEPEFEVVEEEPQPAKKPAVKPKVKAVVELDDDEDEAPRTKRRGNDDDDDQPKKKKRRQRDDDDDKSGVSMTRNIVMGVVLVLLLGVVAFVFYDRFKKKDEDKPSSSDDTKPSTPRVAGPAGPGLPTITPGGVPGAGGPAGGNPGGENPGVGNPVGKKPIGTPGQPITFNSPAGFKVTFPGPYQSDALPPSLREKIGVAFTTHISADLAGGHLYLAGTAEFPTTATATEKKEIVGRIIREAVEDGGDSPVTSRKTVKAGGQDWEELTSKEKIGGTAVTRLLQTDRRLYVIAVAKLDGTPTAEAMKKFFDSFELTK